MFQHISTCFNTAFLPIFFFFFPPKKDSELLRWLSGSTLDLFHHCAFAGWMLVCIWCWLLLEACSALLAQAKWDSPGWCQYRLHLPCWEFQLPAPLPLQSDGPSALPGRQCLWQRFSASLWFPTCYFKCSRSSQDAWKFLFEFNCLHKMSNIESASWRWLSTSQLPFHLISVTRGVLRTKMQVWLIWNQWNYICLHGNRPADLEYLTL